MEIKQKVDVELELDCINAIFSAMFDFNCEGELYVAAMSSHLNKLTVYCKLYDQDKWHGMKRLFNLSLKLMQVCKIWSNLYFTKIFYDDDEAKLVGKFAKELAAMRYKYYKKYPSDNMTDEEKEDFDYVIGKATA